LLKNTFFADYLSIITRSYKKLATPSSPLPIIYMNNKRGEMVMYTWRNASRQNEWRSFTNADSKSRGIKEHTGKMYTKRYKGMLLSICAIVALYTLSFCYGKQVENSVGLTGIDFSEEIVEAARTHDVHPALVAAVIHAESNFNPKARSHRNAKGLMQINPPTQRYLRVKNIYDPQSNIEAGTRYLKELTKLFGGNIKLALAAYNAGPGAVKKYKGIPPYRETRKYVKKVLGYFDQYRMAFTSGSLMS